MGRGVRPASLFMTKICDFPYPIYDLTKGGGHDEEVASSKRKRIQECKNRYPIYYHNGGKMAIINTLFVTKTAEKPYPLEPHIPIEPI